MGLEKQNSIAAFSLTTYQSVAAVSAAGGGGGCPSLMGFKVRSMCPAMASVQGGAFAPLLLIVTIGNITLQNSLNFVTYTPDFPKLAGPKECPVKFC